MKRNFPMNTVATVVLASAVVVVAGSRSSETAAGLLPTPEVPSIVLEGGTPTDHARMESAIQRFEDAGLEVPPVRVVFGSSTADCPGGHGHFTPSTDPWQITICSDAGWVYEHELAHAWERANLTDAQRHEFVTLFGYPTWSDKDYAWNQRGVEGVAVMVQQGLAGLPLPSALSDKALSSLDGYEILTGQVAPRLVEWMEVHGVPASGVRPVRLPDKR